MKAIIRRASHCLVSLVLGLFAVHAAAQTTPAVQGTSIADPAVPVLISPAPTGSGFFVLNQDYSLLQHSTVDTSQNQNCTAPTIFSTTNPAQRTLVTDLYNAYVSGADAPDLSMAVTAITPEVSCQMTTPFDYTGGVSALSLAANDPQHGNYYLVSAYGGSNADSLTVLNNLNNATVASSNSFGGALEASLGLNGQYTSIVSDVRSDFGLTAITELKTDTSPGYLWVYDTGTQNVYKILGPGGVPLPAVTSFIIPPQIDGGGSLLVLVNQDGLTASNIGDPPQDTTPFTIIDLGQLRPMFATNPLRNTITLPFVQQIYATTSFYAMLGAAYNPIDHRIYAVVGGGTSATNVVESVLSYDTLNPSAPAEKVVADVSNVPFTLGSYPQLALNAASGTMQILTASPGAVYSVGINGAGNAAVEVTGTPFSDSNFQPTYITANALQGETYIASASGQVDVMTRPATLQGGLTITLTGSDLGYTSQEYDLKPLALWPLYDDSLGTAKLTITATPDGGAPVTVATGHISDIGYPGSSFYTYTFPAAGRYTLLATAEASAIYPAVTSPPLYVYVGNTGVYPTAITLTTPATAPSTNGEATFNATVNLTGTTYAPTGQVYIQDQTGAEVANISLPKGVISNPLTLPVTIGDGVSTLTAVYSGDEQNQGSTSAGHSITVGTVTLQTTSIGIVAPATASAGTAFNLVISFNVLGAFTTQPTGNIVVTATLAGGTPTTIATVTSAQGMAPGGANVSVTLPNVGAYTLNANYAGDSLYAASANSATVAVAGTEIGTTLGLSGATTQTPGVPFPLTVRLTAQGTSQAQPTGNVAITATPAGGGAALTLATITAAQALTSGGYQAQVTLPSVGSFTIAATYAGDQNFSSSTASLVVTSALLSTTMGLSGVTNQLAGVAFPLTVRLASSSGTPTGNVVITSELATGGKTTTLATVTAAQAMTSGGYHAQVTLSSAGSFKVFATYSGDPNFSGSAASLVIATVFNQPTLLISGPASSAVGANPSYNVTLSKTLGSISATTTLTSTLNGVPGPTGTMNGPDAAITLSFKTPGTYTLTATFAGDAENAPATSNSLTTVVVTQALAPSYTLTLDTFVKGDPPMPVPPSGYLDVPFTLTPVNGFTDTIMLSASYADGTYSSGGLVYRVVDANGKEYPFDPINGSKVTLGTTPLHLKFRMFGANATVSRNKSPFKSGRTMEYAGVIFGILLLGGARRRSWMGTVAKFLVVVLFVSAVGSVLSGCIDSHGYLVEVDLNAAPTHSSGPGGTPQDVLFLAN